MTVQVSDLTVDLTVTPVNDAPVIVRGTELEDANALSSTPPMSMGMPWSASSAAGNGTGMDANTGEVTYHPNADFFGSDSFAVSVSDGALSDSVTVNLTISPVNDAPVLADSPGPLQFQLIEDSQFVYELNFTDSDPGDSISWQIISQPVHGNLVIDANASSFTYHPQADFHGSDSFEISISDSLGASDSLVVNLAVSPVNDPPIISGGGTP